MDWLLTSCVAVVLFILIWVKSKEQTGKSPPGPWPLPLIGNLIYIARQHPVNYIALHKISKKYGDIISLKIGPNNNILISSNECARDIYSRPDCLDRPMNEAILDRMLNQNIGMAFSNGEGWNNIRKYTSRSLREYGFGNRNEMEKLIKNELVHLVNFIKEKVSHSQDGVVYFNKFFQISFLNLMSSMISGERHTYDDKELKDLVRASNEWFETPVLKILTVMAFPWTRFVCPGILEYTRQVNAIKDMHTYTRNLLDKHRQKGNYLKEAKCFTDSFLQMAHDHKHDPSTLFTDDQFAVLCTDLLQGGSDTTSNWLSFAILLLLKNPEVQDKVVQEIATTIGFERTPESKDRERMIYTQAVIYEVHRFSRLLVIPPPRFATEDFVYRDYLIKKGTTIMVNLHSCYMDSDYWEDPETFRPERFLDGNGQLANTENMYNIFGAGRRICFGESLAKESVFLYLTTLLQQFSFNAPPSNYPTPDLEPVPGLVLSTKPYHAHIEKRERQ